MSDLRIDNSKIPNYVTHVTKELEKAGFEAFLVGGCVRDLILGREPKDWDVTTNAKPDDIISIFEKTVYENDFGTVGVCLPVMPAHRGQTGIQINSPSVTPETYEDITHLNDGQAHETKYNIIEVTPYRIETKYSDFRHPDEVKFSDKIEDDLKRRDFTINSMALNSKGHLIDLYKGQESIKDKVISAVGDPNERFQEDALRMLRAVRFSSELGFIVSYETIIAISNNSELIKNVSFERIRDEFTKIIESDDPMGGIILLQKLGLLKYIIPELEEGIGCIQGGAHKYDVFEHLLHALDHSSKKGWGLEIRLSALFHDIGKPKSRRNKLPEKLQSDLSGPRMREDEAPDHAKSHSNLSGSKKPYTFYGHEVIGERLVKKIMERLRYPKKTSDLVVSLVRNHMFFSDTETITLSAVRRMVQKVGKDHIWDLMNVRECDRVGMAKNEAPYRLRKYHAMIEEVLHDPISVGQLAIDGKYLIETLHMKPGPRMGWILSALLEEILDDPKKNTEECLAQIIKSLNMLGDKELKVLGERGKDKKEELEEKEVKKLHMKHGV
jgi:tRNA nucleotidyltransferase (CCA-adding enzyme)